MTDQRYVHDPDNLLELRTKQWVTRINAHYETVPNGPRLLVSVQERLGEEEIAEASARTLAESFDIPEAERGNLVLLLHFKEEDVFHLEGAESLLPYLPEGRLNPMFVRYLTTREETDEQEAFRQLVVEIVATLNRKHGIKLPAPKPPKTPKPIWLPELNRILLRLLAGALILAGAFIAWGGWLAFLIVVSEGMDLYFDLMWEEELADM